MCASMELASKKNVIPSGEELSPSREGLEACLEEGMLVGWWI